MKKLRQEVAISWNSTTKLDIDERCKVLATSSLSTTFDFLSEMKAQFSLSELAAFKEEVRSVAMQMWEVCKKYSTQKSTARRLGAGSKALYTLVREQLGVPFHRGLVEHPTTGKTTLDGRPKKTIGEWISIVYAAVKDGRATAVLAQVLTRDNHDAALKAMRADQSTIEPGSDSLSSETFRPASALMRRIRDSRVITREPAIKQEGSHL